MKSPLLHFFRGKDSVFRCKNKNFHNFSHITDCIFGGFETCMTSLGAKVVDKQHKKPVM